MRAWALRVQHVVDDVDDAVGAEEVCLDDCRGVDVEAVAAVEDGDVSALLGGEFGAVG